MPIPKKCIEMKVIIVPGELGADLDKISAQLDNVLQDIKAQIMRQIENERTIKPQTVKPRTVKPQKEKEYIH